MAERFWDTGEAFHVRDDDFLKLAMENGGFNKMNELRETGIIQDENQWTMPIYQRLGLGSLMIAVSAIVLKSKGITEMDLGTLSEKAKQAWEKFGCGEKTRLSPLEIVSHEKTNPSPINRNNYLAPGK